MMKSGLCVGIDELQYPHWQAVTQLIRSTAPYAAAYKLNRAFHSANALGMIIDLIRADSSALIILDGKYGDVASTSKRYAYDVFEVFKVDAVTLSPWAGRDGLQPFFDYKDKLSFLWAYGSQRSTLQALNWEAAAIEFFDIENVGFVFGINRFNAIASTRRMTEQPLLIPGAGAQHGDEHLRQTIRSAQSNYLINVGRTITESRDPGETAREWFDKITLNS